MGMHCPQEKGRRRGETHRPKHSTCKGAHTLPRPTSKGIWALGTDLPEGRKRGGKGPGSKPRPCLLPTLSALVFLFDQTCQVCFGKLLSLGRVMGEGGVQISGAIVTSRPTAPLLCLELPERGGLQYLGHRAHFLPGFSPMGGLRVT